MIDQLKDVQAQLAGETRPQLEVRLGELREQIKTLPLDDASGRARIKLDIAEIMVALEQKEQAWNEARSAFNTFLKLDDWQQAVESCNVLYQADQPASLAALGMGVWLAVTFPIRVETTTAMLQHIVDETPDNADGAAVAAMTAYYVADLRSTEDKHESNTFLARAILGQVAKRHSQVQSQEQMDAWIHKLELSDPQIFLPRLSLIVNTIVEDNWWFDRDELRNKIPE